MDRHSSALPFNNPTVMVQSWYIAARSKQIGRGRAKSFDVNGRRIALFRDARGVVNALDARCPHLGADLGQGEVVADGLRCAFHHWCFGPDGICRSAPSLQPPPDRRARAYPVCERWGLIWIFNGPRPLFELPAPPPDVNFRAIRLPRQHIGCHPHLVIGNGLDVTHLDTLHGLKLTAPPRLSKPDAYRVSVELTGRPRAGWLRSLTGCNKHEFSATFTAIGGNLAWLTVTQPLTFFVLFTGSVSPSGGCNTGTILFVPRRSPIRLVQSLACMYMILADDHRILEHLDFHPGFTQSDQPLAEFARGVNAMEVW